MAQVTEAPPCPTCGAATVRKPVRRGPRAGLEMWGCTRWPDCWGLINIDSTAPVANAEPSSDWKRPRAGTPGAYAQHRLERERAQLRMKRRAFLPLMVSVTVIGMTATFFGVFGFGWPVASIAAAVVGLILLAMLFRLPAESLVWTKGVEGERKTAEFIEPLLDAGFVVLYNRLIPGLNGDVDSLVIGPTGVFPIESKNWKDKVEIRNDRLFVADHDRTWVIAQVYREALAVQVALGEELTSRRVTVTPVICAIGGTASRSGIAGGVHVVNGKGLARLISDRPTVFDDEAVQRVASLADRRLRMSYDWEVEPK